MENEICKPSSNYCQGCLHSLCTNAFNKGMALSFLTPVIGRIKGQLELLSLYESTNLGEKQFEFRPFVSTS